MKTNNLITFIFLITYASSFQFRQIVVTATTTTIRSTSAYTFTLTRTTNNSFVKTNWDLQSVPNGSNLTIQFPAQYSNQHIAQCSCSLIIIDSNNITNPALIVSGNTVIIMNAITTASFIKSVRIFLSNIINPAPALRTSPFVGTIGVDVGIPNGNAYVQLTMGSLASCSATFNKGFVNTYDNLTISLTSFESMASTNLVYVTFPSSYANSYEVNDTIGVTSAMICVSPQTNSINCLGNNPNSTTVTVYNAFGSNSLTASFQINSILVPPTIQPIDTIAISTYTSGLVGYDRCTVTLSNLNFISMNSLGYSTTDTTYVNKVLPFTFVIPLLTKLYSIDYILINIEASYSPLYQVNGLIGTTGLTLNSKTANVLNISIETDLSIGTTLSITLYNIIAPPSSAISPIFTISFYQALFLKAKGSFTMRAYPNTLTSIVTSAVNPLIGAISKYNVNFIAIDPIPTTGMIRILFPSVIAVGSTINKVTINGQTVTSSILSSFNGISLTNIPSISLNSNIIIGIQNLQNPSTADPITSTLTVMTYYSTSTTDLVDEVTYIPTQLQFTGSQTINYLVYSSSNVVAATNVSLLFVISTKNGISFGGSIAIVLNYMPFSVTNTSCRISQTNQTIIYPCYITTTNSVNTVVINNITSSHGLSFNITISNAFTNPPSTMPQAYFTIITYSQQALQTQRTSTLSQSLLTISNPSPFISFNLSKSSYMNSEIATYTFILKQTSPFFATSNDINELFLAFPSEINISSASCTNCIVNSAAGTILVGLPNSILSSASQISVSISNIRNAPSFQPPSKNISAITLYNTLYNYSRALYPDNYIETINTVPSSMSLANDTAYSIYAVGQQNSLKLNIVSINSFVYYYVLTLSPQFIMNNVTCSAASYTCSYNASYNVIVINKTSPSVNTTNIVVTVSGFNNPIISSDQSLSSSLRGYSVNNYQVNQYSGSLLSWSPNCNLPCQTCSVSNKSACLSCFTNTSITNYIYYYAKQNICLSICYSTQIPSSGNTCIDCTNNCMQCTGTTDRCTACNTSTIYSYYYNFTCIKAADCPLYYYADPTYSCLSCPFPCLACSNSTQCISCAVGAYWYDNNCISTCPFQFTVANAVNKTCDFCDPICATCSLTVDNCTSCGSGAVRFNATCLKDCSPPNYAYIDQCVASCVSPCVTCNVSATYCLSCITNTTTSLYLFQGQCLTSCPSSFVINQTTNLCDPCNSLNLNCNYCYQNQNCTVFGGALGCLSTQYYNCLKCDQNYTYYYNSSLGVYQCVSALPDGYVSINNVAYLCDPSCVTCVNFKTNCTYCSTLHLFNGQCVSACLGGFYSKNITITVNSTNTSTLICTLCEGNCSTCLNQTECLTCKTNSYYDGNYNCIDSSSCPLYTYGNDTYGNCTSCSSPCLACSSYSSCLSCVNFTYLYGNQCINFCPAKYYSQNANNTCTPCSQPCLTCQITSTICTHCINLYYYYSYNNSCLSDCPIGFTINYNLQICQNCTLPCIECSQSVCYRCTQVNSTSYYYFQQQCLSSCPQGYYANNDPLNLTCMACNQSCSSCSNFSYCLACSTSYSLLSPGICVSVCPTYQPVRKIVSGASLCLNCSVSFCALCSFKDECIQCMNYTYILTLGSCITTCAVGFQKIENITNNTALCQKIIPVYEPPFIQGSTFEMPIYFPCSYLAAFFCFIALMIKFIQNCCIGNDKVLLFPLLSAGLALPQIAATYLGAFTYFLLRYRIFLRGPLSWDVFIYLFAISIFIQIILGVYTLIIQTKIEREDSVYIKWSKHSNFCQKLYQYSVNLLTILNFKISHCLWCGIKSLPMLESSNKLVFYNRPSGISALVSLIITTDSIIIIKFHPQLALIYYDIIIVIVLSLLFSLLALRRPYDFFMRSFQQNPHLPLNKRVAESQNYLLPILKPQRTYDSNQFGRSHKSKSQLLNDSISQRSSLQSSFNPLSSQRSSVHLENISIQYSSPSISDKFTSRYEENSQEVRTLGTISVYANPGGFSTLQNIVEYNTKLQYSNQDQGQQSNSNDLSNLLNTNIARLEQGEQESFTAQNDESFIGRQVLPKELRNNYFDVERCHTLNKSNDGSEDFVYFSEHPSIQRSMPHSNQSPERNTNILNSQQFSSYFKSQQIVQQAQQIIDPMPVSYVNLSINSNNQQFDKTNSLSKSKSIIQQSNSSNKSQQVERINDGSSQNNASFNSSKKQSLNLHQLPNSIRSKSISRNVQVNHSKIEQELTNSVFKGAQKQNESILASINSSQSNFSKKEPKVTLKSNNGQKSFRVNEINEIKKMVNQSQLAQNNSHYSFDSHQLHQNKGKSNHSLLNEPQNNIDKDESLREQVEFSQNNLDISVSASIENMNGSLASEQDQQQNIPNVLTVSSFYREESIGKASHFNAKSSLMHQNQPKVNKSIKQVVKYKKREQSDAFSYGKQSKRIQQFDNSSHWKNQSNNENGGMNEDEVSSNKGQIKKKTAKNYEIIREEKIINKISDKNISKEVCISNEDGSDICNNGDESLVEASNQSITIRNSSMNTNNNNSSIEYYSQAKQSNIEPLNFKTTSNLISSIPSQQKFNPLSNPKVLKISQNPSLMAANQLSLNQQSNSQSHISNIFNKSHLSNRISANNSINNPSFTSLSNSRHDFNKQQQKMHSSKKIEQSNESECYSQEIILQQAQSIEFSHPSTHQPNELTLTIQEPLTSKYMDAQSHQFRIRTKKKKNTERKSKEKIMYVEDSQFKALKKQAQKLQKQIRINNKLQKTIEDQLSNSLNQSKIVKLHYSKSGSKQKKKQEISIEKIYNKRPYNSKEKEKQK